MAPTPIARLENTRVERKLLPATEQPRRRSHTAERYVSSMHSSVSPCGDGTRDKDLIALRVKESMKASKTLTRCLEIIGKKEQMSMISMWIGKLEPSMQGSLPYRCLDRGCPYQCFANPTAARTHPPSWWPLNVKFNAKLTRFDVSILFRYLIQPFKVPAFLTLLPRNVRSEVEAYGWVGMLERFTMEKGVMFNCAGDYSIGSRKNRNVGEMFDAVRSLEKAWDVTPKADNTKQRERRFSVPENIPVNNTVTINCPSPLEQLPESESDDQWSCHSASPVLQFTEVVPQNYLINTTNENHTVPRHHDTFAPSPTAYDFATPALSSAMTPQAGSGASNFEDATTPLTQFPLYSPVEFTMPVWNRREVGLSSSPTMEYNTFPFESDDARFGYEASLKSDRFDIWQDYSMDPNFNMECQLYPPEQVIPVLQRANSWDLNVLYHIADNARTVWPTT